MQAIFTGPLRCLVRSIVQEFYGSAVMNFIAWNKATCLFPRTTFKHSGMCVLGG